MRASVPPASELAARRWYAVIDDEIGGYAIATVNKPTSMIDPITTRDRVIAWFTYYEHADDVATRHNEKLEANDDRPQQQANATAGVPDRTGDQRGVAGDDDAVDARRRVRDSRVARRGDVD